MQLTPNLVFTGNAEEVLEHYRDALGGDIQIRRFAETPDSETVSPQWRNKVIYGSLRSPAGLVNAMDAPPGRAGAPGDNFLIGIETDNEADVDKIFAKLSAGGTVIMPLAKTFWSPKFGMFADKFGIKWMVSLTEAA